MVLCKQCLQKKNIDEMSKSGYQRKTGQAKDGMCKKCTNANLLVYKAIKNDAKSLKDMVQAYAGLVNNVHNGVIPKCMPKYIRDILIRDYPNFTVEAPAKRVSSSYDDASFIKSYFGSVTNATTKTLERVASTASSTLVDVLKADFKSVYMNGGRIADLITAADTCLMAARKESTPSTTYGEITILESEVSLLADAVYAGSDEPIVVAGYTFTLEQIDEESLCECADAGDCFCPTILNLVTSLQRFILITKAKLEGGQWLTVK